jgi:hypothetical protein
MQTYVHMYRKMNDEYIYMTINHLHKQMKYVRICKCTGRNEIVIYITMGSERHKINNNMQSNTK